MDLSSIERETREELEALAARTTQKILRGLLAEREEAARVAVVQRRRRRVPDVGNGKRYKLDAAQVLEHLRTRAGSVSVGLLAARFKASPAAVRRRLAELIEQKLVATTGSRRTTRYHAIALELPKKRGGRR